MEKSFKENCEKFINLLKGRGSHRDLRKYDEDKWYKSAYSTIQQRIGQQQDYETWYAENYCKLKKMVLDLLHRLSPNGTISLNDKIERIAKACNVPFGIVQKVVNIMIKYIVCNYYGDNGSFDAAVVKANYPWVADEEFVKTLPIPVDSVVLKNAKQEGARCNIKPYQSTAKLNGRPWSKINRQDYEEFQAEVLRLVDARGMFPLEYEMEILWK